MNRQIPIEASKQLIESNWQLANAFTSGVENRVGNGRRDASDADFSDTVRAQWRELVGNIVGDDLDVRHVEMNRNMILGETGINDASVPLVEKSRFS